MKSTSSVYTDRAVIVFCWPFYQVESGSPSSWILGALRRLELLVVVMTHLHHLPVRLVDLPVPAARPVAAQVAALCLVLTLLAVHSSAADQHKCKWLALSVLNNEPFRVRSMHISYATSTQNELHHAIFYIIFYALWIWLRWFMRPPILSIKCCYPHALDSL